MENAAVVSDAPGDHDYVSFVRQESTQENGGRQNEAEEPDINKCSSSDVRVSGTGSSWYASSLIVMNACLGAGILNLPWAFNRAGGILSAMCVNVVMMLFSIGSAMLLGWSSDLARKNNYQDTISEMCGKWIGRSCSCLIALYTYSTCITFLIVIGDQSDRLLFDKLGVDEFCSHWYYDRRFIVCLLSVILILPLCFFRSIDSLKYISGVATVSVLYLVLLTIVAYMQTDTSKVVVVTSPRSWTDVLGAIPSIAFGYQCHVSAVPVYSCIEPRNLGSFAKTIALAFFACFATYTCVGSFGYLAYGVTVQGDLLSSMSTENWAFAIGYVAFAFKTFLTYPIVQFCGRLSIISLLTDCCGVEPSDRWSRIPVSTIWFVSSLAVALLAPDMSAVIDFLGFLAVAFIFMFPGLSWLSHELTTVESQGPRGQFLNWRVLLSICFVSFGAFLLGLTLAQTIEYAVAGLHGGHHEHTHNFCDKMLKLGIYQPS